MSKRILIVLSERGYWGEELIGPLETFDAAGYQVVAGRSTADSYLTGQKVVEVLDHGLRQWGFHRSGAGADDARW